MARRITKLTVYGITGSRKAREVGAGAVTLPIIIVQGNGNTAHTGSGAITLPIIDVNGLGLVHVKGTGNINLPMIIISGAGGASNYINDILISDGLAVFAAPSSVRNGLFAQKLNNEVKEGSDLISMWNGLGSL